MIDTQNEFLKLISGDEEIIIDVCDGTQLLADAKETFKSGIENYDGFDKPCKPTEKTSVQVYELRNDATFGQMFGSFGIDPTKLCLTHHQIKKFCEMHREWLRTEGYGTFFISEVGGQFYIADVRVESGELCIRGRIIMHPHILYVEGKWPRVVVPRLGD